MIEIKKLNISKEEMLKLIIKPLNNENPKGFCEHRIFESPSLELMKSNIISDLHILILLAKHKFYCDNIKESRSICSTIHLTNSEFELLGGTLQQVFNKVSFSNIILSYSGENIWRVSVANISDMGKKILADFTLEECIPKEICDLYINTTLSDDCSEEGLYSVLGNSNIQDNSIWSVITKNEYINAIDISSMSLIQCANSDMLHYFVANKNKIYIRVEKLPQCDNYLKHLIWF